ncbi:unnamed protein product [Cuscuta campestris]|uniref:MULE transposase domain-containing protein n=1 Tax=Cuscuta campestris TaxID=132261 RepID=A0A484LSU9_9ASTE|nr:unnamed protein product [Cuscuta campestris]
MYYPDLFCRQFGALQHVPQVVVYDRHLHHIKSNVMQIGDDEKQYLEVWEGRNDATVQMEFGMVDATLEYRQCQRLDPGRHPDGFVPSHEVLRVHELLRECVRALGNASILDHPRSSMPTIQDILGDGQIEGVMHLLSGLDVEGGVVGEERHRHIVRTRDDRTDSVGFAAWSARPPPSGKFMCSHCGRTNHTVETCFELVGFPSHFTKTSSGRGTSVSHRGGRGGRGGGPAVNHGGRGILGTPAAAPGRGQQPSGTAPAGSGSQAAIHVASVVSVDGTHLYGKYKGTLLIVVAMTGNGDIFPLAFSIVDAEDGASWKWFMTNIMRHVVPPHRHICIISNMHGGIDHAFNNVPELQGGQVTQRFCHRHLRSNFHNKFRSKKLRNMMYKPGETPSRSRPDWEGVGTQLVKFKMDETLRMEAMMVTSPKDVEAARLAAEKMKEKPVEQAEAY